MIEIETNPPGIYLESPKQALSPLPDYSDASNKNDLQIQGSSTRNKPDFLPPNSLRVKYITRFPEDTDK